MIEFILSLGFIRSYYDVNKFSLYYNDEYIIIRIYRYFSEIYVNNSLIKKYQSGSEEEFKTDLIRITKQYNRKNKLKNILHD